MPANAAAQWARLGHTLGHRAATVLADPAAITIVEVAGTHLYVQWHGEEHDAFYLEASSGLYSGSELNAPQQKTLEALGWARPREGWGKDHALNWSRLFEAPVSLYEVVLLTVATLRDVFGATPQTIRVV